MKPTVQRLPLVKFFEVAQQSIILLLVIATPLTVLPAVSEFLFIPKHLLFFTGAALALFFWLAQAVARKKFVVTVSPLLLPYFLVVATVVISAVVNRVPIAEVLFGRVGLFMSSFFVFLVASSRPVRAKGKVIAALVGCGILLALFTILSFTGALGAFEPPAWMADKSFTPAGNIPTLLIILVAVLPLALALLRDHRSVGEEKKKNLGPILARSGLVLGIIALVAATIITAILIYPDLTSKTPRRMSLSPGWQIAVETLKQHLLFGVGPTRYLSAFTLYRPVSMNTSTAWNQRFLEGPNELLHFFTETGILGLMALLFLLWNIVMLSRTVIPQGTAQKLPRAGSSLLLLTLSLLVVPFNVVTLAFFTMLASLVVVELKEGHSESVWSASLGIVALKEGVVRVEKTNTFDPFAPSIRQSEEPKNAKSAILPWVLFIPGTILSCAMLYGAGRAFQAELAYNQALNAIIKNDGTGAYNSLIRTIRANPLFDTYHRQYAEVNLRLANSLSSRPNLGDQDRTSVAQLVQQAVREGKVAATLDPLDIRNWETLVAIYRALINVTQGAQDFTLLTYSEAIKRDPTNPLLRLELGGVFFGARDWESAIRSYQAAISLKSNYANGYYNLALAYEQDNKIPDAIRALQATIQNLEANSPDYQSTQTKLEELVKKAQSQPGTPQPTPSQEAQGTDQEDRLTAPKPLPTAPPGANRVKLGKEEEPPITPSSVSPTPTQ